MTTIVYDVYANTDDHYIQSSNASYATARAGSGLADTSTGASLVAGQRNDAGTYRVFQAFLHFNTSGLPAKAPDTLTCKIKCTTNSGTKRFDLREKSWSGGTGDFVAGASLSSLVAFGNTTISATGVITFNGPTSFARSATYGLVLYAYDQENNAAPAGYELFFFAGAETAGTVDDPYLTYTDVITDYTMAATVGTFTLTGQPVAFSWGRRLIAAVGSFVLTGMAAALGVKRYPPPGRTINFPASRRDTNRTLEL